MSYSFPCLAEQAEAACAPISYRTLSDLVEEPIGEVLKPAEGKNRHAQALSALGASKGGGLARAAKLSERKRKSIARKAAQSRWAKRSE